MSSFVTVIHAARQYKIQCTPAKILNEVLVEACSRASLAPDNFGLRHGKANLDLSMSIRLAHLPGGAKLDLVRLEAVANARVNIALNVPGHARITATVVPSSTLWQVLQEFETQFALQILQHVAPKDGVLYRQQPIVQLMNKDYNTDEQLQETTLASLGIKSGSAVVRVSYRSTTQVVTTNDGSVMTHVPVPTWVQEPNDIPDGNEREAVTNHEHPAVVSSDIAASTKLDTRETEVWIPSKTGLPRFSEVDDREDDLKMTVMQAKAYQVSLSNRSQATAPLLTQKYRDQQALEKRLKFKPDMCRVKFKFPDNTKVISMFSPTETCSELYRYVESAIEEASPEVILQVSGARERIPDGTQELWRDLQFGKAVAIQVIGNVHIKEDLRRSGRDESEATAETHDTNVSAHDDVVMTNTPASVDVAPKAASGMKKVPKWLQKSLGAKK